ncbi:putative signal-transduction protein [Candidatus Methanoperedens nitroreducens]|uniref:Putative signal-transduction protein n=1 Tax=Candidatus Methanoperedens nitratireducens TaxID=1392998 RepID=A0A062UUN6_9EURY|nr:CBS domain-containing protein [Candidatus Methanoperedens nitroreducens]KCZ70746.1 putative signal-transduction protein [Candidatus Methanoperedens nitroreducens]MDJ1420603.1 CBS domain-containing protein [Candidatus Methanoperedens sp.]
MEFRMPVRDIMTRDVATIDIKSDVQALAIKMLGLDVGSIIITDRERPVGIVTERDIVRKIVSKNILPNDISIRELMTSPLITIPATEDVTNAMFKMVKMKIRRLPVVEGARLIGIVTDTDLIAASVEMGSVCSDLIGMHRERIASESVSQFSLRQGICERCQIFKLDLKLVDGAILCEDCRETT